MKEENNCQPTILYTVKKQQKFTMMNFTKNRRGENSNKILKESRQVETDFTDPREWNTKLAAGKVENHYIYTAKPSQGSGTKSIKYFHNWV